MDSLQRRRKLKDMKRRLEAARRSDDACTTASSLASVSALAAVASSSSSSPGAAAAISVEGRSPSTPSLASGPSFASLSSLASASTPAEGGRGEQQQQEAEELGDEESSFCSTSTSSSSVASASSFSSIPAPSSSSSSSSISFAPTRSPSQRPQRGHQGCDGEERPRQKEHQRAASDPALALAHTSDEWPASRRRSRRTAALERHLRCQRRERDYALTIALDEVLGDPENAAALRRGPFRHLRRRHVNYRPHLINYLKPDKERCGCVDMSSENPNCFHCHRHSRTHLQDDESRRDGSADAQSEEESEEKEEGGGGDGRLARRGGEEKRRLRVGCLLSCEGAHWQRRHEKKPGIAGADKIEGSAPEPGCIPPSHRRQGVGRVQLFPRGYAASPHHPDHHPGYGDRRRYLPSDPVVVPPHHTGLGMTPPPIPPPMQMPPMPVPPMQVPPMPVPPMQVPPMPVPPIQVPPMQTTTPAYLTTHPPLMPGLMDPRFAAHRRVRSDGPCWFASFPPSHHHPTPSVSVSLRRPMSRIGERGGGDGDGGNDAGRRGEELLRNLAFDFTSGGVGADAGADEAVKRSEGDIGGGRFGRFLRGLLFYGGSDGGGGRRGYTGGRIGDRRWLTGGDGGGAASAAPDRLDLFHRRARSDGSPMARGWAVASAALVPQLSAAPATNREPRQPLDPGNDSPVDLSIGSSNGGGGVIVVRPTPQYPTPLELLPALPPPPSFQPLPPHAASSHGRRSPPDEYGALPSWQEVTPGGAEGIAPRSSSESASALVTGDGGVNIGVVDVPAARPCSSCDERPPASPVDTPFSACGASGSGGSGGSKGEGEGAGKVWGTTGAGVGGGRTTPPLPSARRGARSAAVSPAPGSADGGGGEEGEGPTRRRMTSGSSLSSRSPSPGGSGPLLPAREGSTRRRMTSSSSSSSRSPSPGGSGPLLPVGGDTSRERVATGSSLSSRSPLPGASGPLLPVGEGTSRRRVTSGSSLSSRSPSPGASCPLLPVGEGVARRSLTSGSSLSSRSPLHSGGSPLPPTPGVGEPSPRRTSFSLSRASPITCTSWSDDPFLAQRSVGIGLDRPSPPLTPRTPSTLGDESVVLRGVWHLPSPSTPGRRPIGRRRGRRGGSRESGSHSSATYLATSSLDVSSHSREEEDSIDCRGWHGVWRARQGPPLSPPPSLPPSPLPSPPLLLNAVPFSAPAEGDEAWGCVPERLEHNRRRARSTSVSVLSESDRMSILQASEECVYCASDEENERAERSGGGESSDASDPMSESRGSDVEDIITESHRSGPPPNDEESLGSFRSDDAGSSLGGGVHARQIPAPASLDSAHRASGAEAGRSRSASVRTDSAGDNCVPGDAGADHAAGVADVKKTCRSRHGSRHVDARDASAPPPPPPPPPPPVPLPMHPPRHPSFSSPPTSLQDLSLSQSYSVPGQSPTYGSRTSQGSRASLRSTRSLISDQSSYVSSESSEEKNLDDSTDSSNEEHRSLPITPSGTRLRSVSTSGESNMVDDGEISEISSSTTSSYSVEEANATSDSGEDASVEGDDDQDWTARDLDGTGDSGEGVDRRDGSLGSNRRFDSITLRAHEERCKDKHHSGPMAAILVDKNKNDLTQETVSEPSCLDGESGRSHGKERERSDRTEECAASFGCSPQPDSDGDVSAVLSFGAFVEKDNGEDDAGIEEVCRPAACSAADRKKSNESGGSDHDSQEVGDEFHDNLFSNKVLLGPCRASSSSISWLRASRARGNFCCIDTDMSYSESECSQSVSLGMSSVLDDFESPLVIIRKGGLLGSPEATAISPLAGDSTPSRTGSRNDLSMMSSDGEGDMAAGENSKDHAGAASDDSEGSGFLLRPSLFSGFHCRFSSDGSAESSIALRGVAQIPADASPSPTLLPRHSSPDLISCIPGPSTAAHHSPPSGPGARHKRHRSDGMLNFAAYAASRGRIAGTCASTSGGGPSKRPPPSGGPRKVQLHRRSTSLESSLQVIFENKLIDSAAAVSTQRPRVRRAHSPSAALGAAAAVGAKRAKQNPPDSDGAGGGRPLRERRRTETPASGRTDGEEDSSAAAEGPSQKSFARGVLLGSVIAALFLTSFPVAFDLLLQRRIVLLPLLGFCLFSGGSCESDLVIVQVKFPTAAFRRAFGFLFLLSLCWFCSKKCFHENVMVGGTWHRRSCTNAQFRGVSF